MCKRLFAIFLLLALTACHSKQSLSGLTETHMQIGGQPFVLELALTPAQQELGLMHRDHLDADHGMLFIFSDEKLRTFWNHDVSFPLDLVFLDALQKIASIKRLETYSEAIVASDVPAKYAIELNAGTATQLHLQPGNQLKIPQDAIDAQNTAGLSAR
jgi:uncharacterized membrane protein (UPF0127 family)